MSLDPEACYCGGGRTGHVVGCPSPARLAPDGPVVVGVDLSTRRDRVVLRCACGNSVDLDGDRRLVTAALMVTAVRPRNWDDDEDPDQVAAWSALEEALRACGALPHPTIQLTREALDGVMP